MKSFYKASYIDLDEKTHFKTFECSIGEDGFFDTNDAFNKASTWVESHESISSKISLHTIKER